MSHPRKQIPVRRVSTRAIVASRAFAYGFAEARRGAPFDPDLYPGPQSWNYERGRALAFIVPLDMPLRIGRKLNPKILKLATTAFERKLLR